MQAWGCGYLCNGSGPVMCVEVAKSLVVSLVQNTGEHPLESVETEDGALDRASKQ